MTDTVPQLSPAPDLRARAGGENFRVASLLLRASTREHLLSVYEFARFVDEIGDTAAGDRLELLDRAELELDRAFEGTTRDPLFGRLARTIADRGLPREPFVRLIEANRLDQRKHTYASFDELCAYCELSANPVGELVLHIFEAATPGRVRLSDDVCTALQLIEHWQDVAEDAARGRIYLPLDDMREFGVTPDDLEARRAGLQLRRLLAFEADRASRLLESGAPLVRQLRGRARIAVAGYIGGGRAALEALAHVDYDVLTAVPHATRRAILRATVANLGRAA